MKKKTSRPAGAVQAGAPDPDCRGPAAAASGGAALRATL